jgi:WD40 repeat protein
VRVWDAATGVAIGEPFTGHTGSVNAVAMGQLEGRPVIVSGSADRTVRVWDAATGVAIGEPFTGHTGSVNAVAMGQLEGRPVIVSGSADRTVRVWDAVNDQRAHTMWDACPAVINMAAETLGLAIGSTFQLLVATELGIACLLLSNSPKPQ